MKKKYGKGRIQQCSKTEPYLFDFKKFEHDLLGLDFSKCPNDFRAAVLDYHHKIRELRSSEHAFLVAQRNALSYGEIEERHNVYIRTFAAYRDAVDNMCALAKKYAAEIASRDLLMQY